VKYVVVVGVCGTACANNCYDSCGYCTDCSCGGGGGAAGGAIYCQYTAGSINFNLLNELRSAIVYKQLIPGRLNTLLLENGDYIEPTIIQSFKLLKTIEYDNSIIENIKYNLTAFIVAITLEQKITEYTIALSKQVVAGTLSIEEFNESVKNYSKSEADKVPENYFFNFNKVDKAINDNLYILTDTPCGCDKPDKEPCGCKH